MMGASRLLVRFTVRMRPFCRSSFDEEMAIWLDGGVEERTLFIRMPAGGGEAPRLDILVAVKKFEVFLGLKFDWHVQKLLTNNHQQLKIIPFCNVIHVRKGLVIVQSEPRELRRRPINGYS